MLPQSPHIRKQQDDCDGQAQRRLSAQPATRCDDERAQPTQPLDERQHMRLHLQCGNHREPEGRSAAPDHHRLPSQQKQNDAEDHLNVRPEFPVVEYQPRVGRHEQGCQQTDQRSPSLPPQDIRQCHRQHTQSAHEPDCCLDTLTGELQWQREKIDIECAALDAERGAAAEKQRCAAARQIQAQTGDVRLVVLELDQRGLPPPEGGRQQQCSQDSRTQPTIGARRAGFSRRHSRRSSLLTRRRFREQVEIAVRHRDPPERLPAARSYRSLSSPPSADTALPIEGHTHPARCGNRQTASLA